MAEGTQHVDLFEMTQKIEVTFVKMFTVKDFVRDLKAKRLKLFETKNIDLIPNFKSVFQVYESQLNMNTYLYTFNLRYKKNVWKSAN